MALVKPAIVFNEAELKNPYIKLTRVTGGKSDGKWMGFFGVFANKKMADEKRPATDMVLRMSVPWVDGEHPEPALYAALKATNGFEDA